MVDLAMHGEAVLGDEDVDRARVLRRLRGAMRHSGISRASPQLPFFLILRRHHCALIQGSLPALRPSASPP